MTTDDRIVSGASSLNPNKSSGDIVDEQLAPIIEIVRLCVEAGKEAGKAESAAEIERLRRENEARQHMADKNYALWNEAISSRDAAVKAAYEEAEKIIETAFSSKNLADRGKNLLISAIRNASQREG